MKTKFIDKRKRNATEEDIKKYDDLLTEVRGFALENGPLRNVTRMFDKPKKVTDIMNIHPHRKSFVKYQYHFDRIENSVAIYRMNCN